MKRIFITVDTECHNGALENNYIWGDVKGTKYGIPMILEEGKRAGVPINFFFDMCEANRCGEEYATRIIDCIRSYDQPVYLHLHPNYVSGDDQKSYLWQYDYDEQKNILATSIAQYKRLTGKDSLDVFRAGRYSASRDMYRALAELGEHCLDLSYCYKNEKMCKLTYAESGTINAPTTFWGQTLLPNTRFICFDYLGKKRALNTDLREAQLGEIKSVLKNTDGDVVFTIHSWHFFDRYFFTDKIKGNKKQIKKFRKIIRFCKDNGWTFADLGKESFETSRVDENIYNNCRTPWQKLKSLVYNFFRFQDTAKLNKKYFALYFAFYAVLALGGAALIAWLITLIF